MKLLYGPVPDQGITPFHGVFDSNWHLASQRGWLRKQGPQPDAISFSMDSCRDTVLEQILPQLPSDWLPDVFLFCFPERYALPSDLGELRKKGVFLVALVGDWYLVLDSLLSHKALFDHWISDLTCVPHLKTVGISSIQDFPVFSMDLGRFCKIPYIEKDIDVAFIGNLRSSIHTRRARYLRRLAALSEQFSIFIGQELYGEAYVKTFNRARMVFNLAVHGEFNMRCFETLGCGSLLLLEADNQEVSKYLEAGKDYVAYETGNFETLIKYYAEHHAEREQIASTGYQAIKNYGARKSWQKLKTDLSLVWQRNKSLVRDNVLPVTCLLSEEARRDYAHHLFWSVTPPDDYLSFAVEVLHAGSNLSAMDWNDFGVMAYTHCMRLQAGGGQVTTNDWERAEQAFAQAYVLASNCSLVGFNQAQLSLAQSDYKRAQQALKRCLDHLQEVQDSLYWQGLWAYPELGLVFEKFYHRLLHHRQRLLRAYLSTGKDVPGERWSQFLESQALILLGYCALHEQDADAASSHWQTAFELAPEWSEAVFSDLSELFLRKNQATKVLELIASDLGDPLDPRLWLMHGQALHMTGRYAEGAAWKAFYLRQLESLPIAAKSSWRKLLMELPLALDLAAEWLSTVKDKLMRGFEILEYDVSQEELDALVFSSLALDWQNEIEPAPDWVGFAWSPDSHRWAARQQCRYVLTIAAPSARSDFDWQRVYDQPSDLKMRRLGLDLLPASFAQEPLPLELLEECQPNLLLCLIQPGQTEDLIQFLALLEQELLKCSGVHDWSVAIWCPERELEDSEQDALGVSLADSQLALLLLPALQPGEVLTLLKRSQMVWLQPHDRALYYLWWALHLGITPWLAYVPQERALAYGLDLTDLDTFVVDSPDHMLLEALKKPSLRLIERMAEIKHKLTDSDSRRLESLVQTAYLLRVSAHQSHSFGLLS